jgi:hypothetical protein
MAGISSLIYSFGVAGILCELDKSIITPSKTNYSFSPTNIASYSVTTNQIHDFTAVLVAFTISDTTTFGGNPMSGVTVSCPGANTETTVITNVNGIYTFTVNP